MDLSSSNEVLIQGYERENVYVDSLPYTRNFDRILQRIPAVPSKHIIWMTLINMRKAGGILPSLRNPRAPEPYTMTLTDEGVGLLVKQRDNLLRQWNDIQAHMNRLWKVMGPGTPKEFNIPPNFWERIEQLCEELRRR